MLECIRSNECLCYILKVKCFCFEIIECFYSLEKWIFWSFYVFNILYYYVLRLVCGKLFVDNVILRNLFFNKGWLKYYFLGLNF